MKKWLLILAASLLILGAVSDCINSRLIVSDVEIGETSVSFDASYPDHFGVIKSYDVKEKNGDLYITVRRSSTLWTSEYVGRITVDLDSFETKPRRIILREWLHIDKTMIEIPPK